MKEQGGDRGQQENEVPSNASWAAAPLRALPVLARRQLSSRTLNKLCETWSKS